MANYADITNVTNTWQLVAAVSENVIWTPTDGPIFIYPSNTHPDTVGTNGLLLQPYESFTVAGGTPVYYKGAAGNEFCISRIAADHKAIPGYDPGNDMLKVQSIQKKMRDSFTRPLTDQWDTTLVGGTTATNTAGVLTIASGTTPGAYAELLSKETFTIPFRAMFCVQNGRHANNHQLIEAVSVDPVTGIPDGKHSVDMDLGGAAFTSATAMSFGTQNGGLRTLRSASSTIVSTATYSILELEPFSDEAYFHSRTMDSTTGRSNSYVRHQQIPDPTAVYKLRIRSMNHAGWMDGITNVVDAGKIRITSNAHGRSTGNVVWVEQLNGVTNAGAPVYGNYTITVIDANTFDLNGTDYEGPGYVVGSGRWALAAAPTSVNLQFQFVNCQDYAELTAEITAGRGQIVEGQAIAARTVAGSVVTATLANNSTVAVNSTVYYDDTATNLAAGATFTGTTRDLGTAAGTRTSGVAKFQALAIADQAGTMRLEFSRDGTTWRRGTVDTAVAANTPALVSIPVLARYFRVIYVNGATAQGSFMLQSGFNPA